MMSARVLVVDDNPLNVELVHYVLTAADFQVWVASDAEEALAVLPEADPALILMDVQLPGRDGLSLTRQLKADPATRHIVIVAFTAHAMKGDELAMRAAGCDGYVAKPIDVGRLAATLTALLPAAQGRSLD